MTTNIDSFLEVQGNEDYVEYLTKADEAELIVYHHPMADCYKPIMPGTNNYHNEDCGCVIPSKKDNKYRAGMCNRHKSLQIKRHYCGNRKCPICYAAATYREAERAVKRLFAWQWANGSSLYHWTVSLKRIRADGRIEEFPPEKATMKEFVYPLRKMVYSFFEAGGVIFYHPLRLNKEDKDNKFWEEGLHFHIITLQKMLNIEVIQAVFLEQGIHCVAKNIKWEEAKKNHENPNKPYTYDQLVRLVGYELSHAANFDESKSVAFFGKFCTSKNGFKCKKLILEDIYDLCSCKQCRTEFPVLNGYRSAVVRIFLNNVENTFQKEGHKTSVKTTFGIEEVTNEYLRVKKYELYIPNGLVLSNVRDYCLCVGVSDAFLSNVSALYYAKEGQKTLVQSVEPTKIQQLMQHDLFVESEKRINLLHRESRDLWSKAGIRDADKKP